MKLNVSPDGKYVQFMCPGCCDWHDIKVKSVGCWKWNGSVESPTLRPSVLARKMEGKIDVVRCHSYITKGQIQFLDDCTHSLAGQTVEMHVTDGEWY